MIVEPEVLRNTTAKTVERACSLILMVIAQERDGERIDETDDDHDDPQEERKSHDLMLGLAAQV